jgi:dihydrodipicolinate synthase/N-acetylneuraminate lyase
MSDDLYSGMFPALLIPMNPDYSVDIDALVEHINYLCKNGCKGGLVYIAKFTFYTNLFY